jgi:flagellar protein FliO/FliZ
MASVILLLRVMLSLACVLGLIWFAGRKLSGTAGVRRQRSVPLTVLGRQSLGKGAGIALVEVAGRVLLLGVGEQGVRVLTEIEVPVLEVPAGLTAGAVVGANAELREEIDLDALDGLAGFADRMASPARPGAPAEGLARLAGLAGLSASVSARESGALHGSIMSRGTWRRAVDVVQQRTARR